MPKIGAMQKHLKACIFIPEVLRNTLTGAMFVCIEIPIAMKKEKLTIVHL